MSGELVCTIRSVDIGGGSPSALGDHIVKTSTKRSWVATLPDGGLVFPIFRFSKKQVLRN